MDKGDDIGVGDVVQIKAGKRYPPTEGGNIGIIIEEMPRVDGFEPLYIVMWDGQVDGLPTRRLKKIDKPEHVCTKQPASELN